MEEKKKWDEAGKSLLAERPHFRDFQTTHLYNLASKEKAFRKTG